MSTPQSTFETTTVTNPVTFYQQSISSLPFLVTVFFRGHWCPFCMNYLRELNTLLPSIASHGGRVLVVTAEPGEENIAETRKASGYQGKIIIDTKHELATYLRENGRQRGVSGSKGVVNVAVTERKGYENGVAQPAIVAVRQDGEVLFSWAIVPALMNLGGAKDRPQLTQVWQNIEAKLDDKPVVHKKLALQSFFSVLAWKFFG